MIKINLLEVDKERKTRKGGGAPAVAGAAPTGILAIGIIGLGVAALAFQFVRYTGKLSDVQKDLDHLRQKKEELKPFIEQVDELEQRRNELQKKSEAIEQLRSQRTIPVHILDEVSRALPDYLWVTGLTVKAELLSVDGTTFQEQAISTFMKNLQASEFLGPCNLIESKQQTQKGSTAQITNFKISAPITNPFKPKVTEEAATTTTTTKKKKK